MPAVYPPPGQPYPSGPPAPPGPQAPWGPAGPQVAAPAVRAADRATRRRLIGSLLILPAFVLLIVSHAWPTAWNLWTSFREVSTFGGTPSSFVGLANYQAALRQGFLGDLGYALTLALVPLLVVGLIAPALAWAAHRAGTAARWVVRVALALPLVVYLPTALAFAYFVDRAQARSPRPIGTGDVTASAWLGTFGLGCAVAVTAYLAAFRRRTTREQAWRAPLVVGGVLALASIALALQEFTSSFVLAGGRYGNTPLIELYRAGLMHADLGVGSAIATLLLIPLAVIGTATAVLLIVTRARIEVDAAYRTVDEAPGWPPSRIAAAVAGAAILAVMLTLTGRGLWPWLSRLSGSAPAPLDTGSVVAQTWVPPLISTVVGVTLALLAAVGIAVLRPLGRRSEWLLLPFAPWLFVGTGPYLLHRYANGPALGSFTSLIPPIWVAVPALFVATLLLRGQESRLRATGRSAAAVVRTLVLPALPMLPVLFGAVWLWQAQDLLGQLLVVIGGPDRMTAAIALVALLHTYALRNDVSLGLALPVGMLVTFVLAAVAAQLGYLDRVAVRVGPEEPAGAPDSPVPLASPPDPRLR